MKKTLILVLVAFLPILAIAQSKPDTLFFANGEKAVVTISKMSSEEVEYSYPNEVIVNIAKTVELAGIHLGSGRIVIYNNPIDSFIEPDIPNYPDSFTLEIEGDVVEMVLVKGGTFNMGYDGRHSIKYNSEPIHPVTLTPYYMSKRYILNTQMNYMLGKEKTKKKEYVFSRWKVADDTVTAIAKKTGLNYRLPTEAEWEYAATDHALSSLFVDAYGIEWCQDLFSYFTNTNYPLVDPLVSEGSGPHVNRSYGGDFYDRHPVSDKAYFRIAIKAADAFPDL